MDPKKYWETLSLHLRGVKLKINEALKNGETQVVVGGDNSVTFSSLLAVLEIVKSHPSWSLDMVEVNPKKMGAEKTIRYAQKIIQFMLK